MTRTLLMLLTTVALTATMIFKAAPAQAAQPLRLRVLSYNIHHAAGIDGKLDLKRIAGVMLSVQPDIIAVQEVDQNVGRTQTVDQPAELARLTNMHVIFGANIKLQGGHYGNALLSRFPIIKHTNHLLPNVDAGEQRGVLEAELQLPGIEQPLLFYATHLDYRRDDRERLESATMINQLVNGHPNHPAILAGDLNATPASATLRRFQSTWQSVNTEPLPTVPVKQPKSQIDYILTRPTQHWNVVEVKVLDEAIASDHRAIFTVLELIAD